MNHPVLYLPPCSSVARSLSLWLKAVRASVGPDFPLMIDCYMALTVPYAVELARRVDREVPGGVKWLEEVLPPDDYEGYAEVKSRVGTLQGDSSAPKPGLTLIWMFHHLAQLHSHFCPIPICPSRTGQTVEQLKSKSTQPRSWGR